MKSLFLITTLAGAALAGTPTTPSIETCNDHAHHDHFRPDSHAPISVMGDHMHGAGEWMLSYRYMFMEMDGMYQGSNAISPTQVYNAGYAVSPTRMKMDMHMVGLMYAPSDQITLMAMLPYTTMEMDHRIDPTMGMLIMLNGGSDTFTTESSGVGDLRLGALFRVLDRGPHHIHGGLAFSLPTASIGEKDLIPGPGGRLPRQLPASMQVGSGTFDILPSLTWVYTQDSWSGGVQAHANIRTGTNHHDYRLGHRFGIDSWISYRAANWVSLSAGLTYIWEDELSGLQSDVALAPPMPPGRLTVPTAFGSNYGGQRIEALIGANFVVPSGPIAGQRLAVDLRVPLWQDRNGYGLGTDYTFTAGWQCGF